MAKFKVGDKVIKANGRRWTTGEKYKKIELADSLVGYKVNNCLGYWKEEELKLFKEDKMKKTFRELIIGGIKPGEIWENKTQRISRIYLNEYGNLQLEGEDSSFAQNYSTCIGLEVTYELQRKEYTFEEAFKAYEEGKEIESIETGEICCKSDWIRKYGNDNEGTISRLAIRNKWYIND